MIKKHKLTKNNVFNVYKFVEDIFVNRTEDIKLALNNLPEVKKQANKLSDDELSVLVDSTLNLLINKIFISLCLLVESDEGLKILNSVDYYKNNKAFVDTAIKQYGKKKKKKSNIIIPK